MGEGLYGDLTPEQQEVLKLYDKLANRKGPRKPPIDVGDGWLQIDNPVTMLADAKIYQKAADDGFFSCIVERRSGRDDPGDWPDGRWHLSLSHNSHIAGVSKARTVNVPKRIPTWAELKEVRYKFLPDGVNMAIMMPPQSDYVNIHETCLHLVEIPLKLALKPDQGGI